MCPPYLQVPISDFFLITYLQFSYALNTELLEDRFYSLVARDVVFSYPMTLSPDNATFLLLFTMLSVLVVRIPVEVHLIPVLGVTGPGAGHLTPVQTAVVPPGPGAERDE